MFDEDNVAVNSLLMDFGTYIDSDSKKFIALFEVKVLP